MVRGALRTGRHEIVYFSMAHPGKQRMLRPEEGEVRLVALDELMALNGPLGKQIDALRKEDKFPWFDTQKRDSHPVYVDANDVTAYLLDRQGRVRSNADFQDLWSILGLSITFPVARRIGWRYHSPQALNGAGKPTHLGILLNGDGIHPPLLQEESGTNTTISPFVAVLATQVYAGWKEEGRIRYDTQHDQYYVRVGTERQEGDLKERYVGLEKRVSVVAASLASGLYTGTAKRADQAAMKRLHSFQEQEDPANKYFETKHFEIKLPGQRSKSAGMKAIGTLYFALIASIGRKNSPKRIAASVVTLDEAASLLFHADREYVERAFVEVGLRPYAGSAYRPEEVRRQLITPVMDATIKMYLQPAR